MPYKELAMVIVVVAVASWLSFQEGVEMDAPVINPTPLASPAQESRIPDIADLPDPDRQAVMLRLIPGQHHTFEVEIHPAGGLTVESFTLESDKMAAALSDPGGAMVEPNRWQFTESALTFWWLGEGVSTAPTPRLPKIDDRWVPPPTRHPHRQPTKLEPGIWRAKATIVSTDPNSPGDAKRIILESPPVAIAAD